MANKTKDHIYGIRTRASAQSLLAISASVVATCVAVFTVTSSNFPLAPQPPKVSIDTSEFAETANEQFSAFDDPATRTVQCEVLGRLEMCEVRSLCVRYDAEGSTVEEPKLLVRLPEARACKHRNGEAACRKVLMSVIEGQEDFRFDPTPIEAAEVTSVKWIKGGTAIAPANHHALRNVYHQVEVLSAIAEAIVLTEDERLGRDSKYARVLIPQHHLFGGLTGGYGLEAVQGLFGSATPYNKKVLLLPNLLRESAGGMTCFERAMITRKRSPLMVSSFVDRCGENDLVASDCELTIPAVALLTKNNLPRAKDVGSETHHVPEASRTISANIWKGGAAPPKRITYLSRGGSDKRRLVNEKAMISMLRTMARRAAYEFDIAQNEGSFVHQARLLSRCGIVVSVHGANLVNCMFMPTASALIEIQPGKMDRGAMTMYWRGGNSGVHYAASASVNVRDHSEVGTKYHSADECIAASRDCDKFYRNSAITANLTDVATHLRGAIQRVNSFSNGYSLVPLAPSFTSWGWHTGFQVVPA